MAPNINKKVSSYRRFSGITVVAVYFLILVGGIVRSTGSGMGCPDWPKCFGSVIPPTRVDQLPANYQEIYLTQRLAKNERFVATLNSLGFRETADKLANDKSIQVEEEFNATKTWIEYINRLIGVLIGLLIIGTVIKSFSLWSVDRGIAGSAFAALVLVLFTGWVGSIVVSTNLLPWMITFHMLLALALVAVLLYSYHRAGRLVPNLSVGPYVPKKVIQILVVGMVLMLVQIVLGTQVREAIDAVSFALGNLLRGEWVERTGLVFLVHRSFSLVLLGVHVVYFFWAFTYAQRKSPVSFWSQALVVVLLFEIGSGMGMAYFAIPAFLQPLHLVLGSLILGIQFLLVLHLRDQDKHKVTSTSL
jgi:heme a synthase